MSPPAKPQSTPMVDVFNARHNEPGTGNSSIRDQVIRGLTADASKRDNIVDETGREVQWSKSLPIAILYEGDGIRLYEAITRSSGYYLYREEMAIVTKNMDDIASLICEPYPESVDYTSWPSPVSIQRIDSAIDCDINSQSNPAISLNVIDLGAGRPDKAMVLLDAIHNINSCEKPNFNIGGVNYFAVDLQYESLRTRLAEAAASRPFFSTSTRQKDKILIRGVCGTYQTALRALQDHFQLQNNHKCLLWLGSSVTNFEPSSAMALLREFCCISGLGPGDSLLVGVDRCQDLNRLSAAYGSQSPHWKEYVLNGLRNAGKVLGCEAEKALQNPDNWEYVAKWDAASSRHIRFVKAKRPISCRISEPERANYQRTIDIQEGEHIFLSQSYKYECSELLQLFGQASLRVVKEWRNESDDGSMYLLRTT